MFDVKTLLKGWPFSEKIHYNWNCLREIARFGSLRSLANFHASVRVSQGKGLRSNDSGPDEPLPDGCRF